MDLAVYLIGATVVTFMVGAGVALALAMATGQFRNLNSASLVVLDGDDPMPVRMEGER